MLNKRLINRKLVVAIFCTCSSLAYADMQWWYGGVGAGLGSQGVKQNYMGESGIVTETTGGHTTAERINVGYQFHDWLGVELGYNYLNRKSYMYNDDTQSGYVQTHAYDLSVLPGFTIPETPITVFARMGIDTMSTVANSSQSPLLIGNPFFLWGVGAKWNIPDHNLFIRAELIQFGHTNAKNTPNFDSSNYVTTSPEAMILDINYVFK